MAVKISVAQANSFRLSRHHLSLKADKRELATVVSDVCGIQAQVLSAAELALRARVEGVEQSDVRNALWGSRTILKTWCMRGTLHLLASTDLPLYVGALKSKLEETERWLQKDVHVSSQETAQISAAIGEVLAKKALSREELSREVAARLDLRPRTRKALLSAWGILLRPAAFQGGLAFGENIGSKVTFVNPAVRVRPWREPPVNEAKLELFRRFLRAFGPAKIADFGRWWGNLSRDDRSVLASISDELEEVEFGGFKGLMLKRDAEEAGGLEPSRGVHLLPSFDCYAMHYSPRGTFVPETLRERIFSKEAGWVFPCVVINGQAAGIWSLRKKALRSEIDIETFRVFSSKEKVELEAETTEIGRFYGSVAEVRYRPVRRG